jgi:hypothetical protein
MKRRRLGLLILPLLLAGCSSSSASPTGPTGGSGHPSGPSMPFDAVSVPYGIFVGLIYTGAPCGAYTNSGYFSRLDFGSELHRIVFVAPTTSGVPGPIGAVLNADSDMKAAIPYQQVHGVGKVESYTLCPMYETDTDSYTCTVADGPHDFTVNLSVDQPLGGEGSATLRFSSTSAEVGRPIMRWNTRIGSGEWGGVGGGEIAFFDTTWADLMSGEEFAFDHSVTGDDGDVWNWSVRFMPETS